MAVETAPRGDENAVTPLEPEENVVEAAEQADAESSTEVMSLLAEGVPLALLADLADPSGPASPEILQDEGLPDVAWWDAAAGHEHAQGESEAPA